MTTTGALRIGAVLIVVIVVYVSYLFIRVYGLERSFRQIHPDETEARLLETVGKPTEIRRCEEGRYKVVNETGSRRCAKVYWYSAYPFEDGWLVPLDETAVIMQINRLGLP